MKRFTPERAPNERRYTPEKLSRPRSRDQGPTSARRKKKSIVGLRVPVCPGLPRRPHAPCDPTRRGARTPRNRTRARPIVLAGPLQISTAARWRSRARTRAGARGRGLGRRSLATNSLPARSTNASTLAAAGLPSAITHAPNSNDARCLFRACEHFRRQG
jgi:hypothetical protein